VIAKVLALYVFAGVLFLSIMFVYSLYRGKSGFAKALGLLCLSLDIYLMGYLMEINSETLSEMLFWNQIQYFGIPFFPALWLLMSMLYTGRIKGLWEWKFALVFIIPILTFLFRLTNKYHYLYYAKIELKEIGGIQLMLLSKGPWYFVQMGYVLICLILCTRFYYQRYVKSSNVEKNQFRLFLLASLLPYVGTILVTINLANIGIDYSALVLPLSIMFINIALTRYNFLEIKLMARERVFEDSQEGLIILNKDLEVMDFNPASIGFFNWMNAALKRERLDVLLENHTGVVECVKRGKEGTFEFMVGGKERFMSVTPKEICSKKELVGILLAMEDVTERELNNRKLLEMAHYDMLSGLYSRRFYSEQAQAAIERAKRYGELISVIMMDIDNFKWINDKYGHSCGDRVIRAVSDLMKSFFRGTDIIGRIGGEEFSIIMLNSKSNEAYARVEALRINIEQMDFEYNGQKIPVTVSLGIAELENHCQSLDDLINCADDALYKSKNNGRNRTTIYKK
jgi:diguanylate cyclase (GGDEF)-like protein